MTIRLNGTADESIATFIQAKLAEEVRRQHIIKRRPRACFASTRCLKCIETQAVADLALVVIAKPESEWLPKVA